MMTKLTVAEIDQGILREVKTNIPAAIKLGHRVIAQALDDPDDFGYKILKQYERWEHNLQELQKLDRTWTVEGKMIAFSCLNLERAQKWDPDSLKSGIGEAEEALIRLGKGLAQLGYRVTIYANPPQPSIYSLPYNNPRYLPFTASYRNPINPKYDAVICWRHNKFKFLSNIAHKVYAWVHDVIVDTKLPTDDTEVLAGCIFPSAYHSRILSTFSPFPQVIAPYGSSLAEFEVKVDTSSPLNISGPVSPWNQISERNCSVMLVTDYYSAGIPMLLAAWPDIRQKYPTAMLNIYSKSVNWKSKIDMSTIKNLRKFGVSYHGKVNLSTFHLALSKCTIFIGAFGVDIVAAQKYGKIPIVPAFNWLNEIALPSHPRLSAMTVEEYVKALHWGLAVKSPITQVNDEKDVELKMLKPKDKAQEPSWLLMAQRVDELLTRPVSVPVFHGPNPYEHWNDKPLEIVETGPEVDDYTLSDGETELPALLAEDLLG